MVTGGRKLMGCGDGESKAANAAEWEEGKTDGDRSKDGGSSSGL